MDARDEDPSSKRSSPFNAVPLAASHTWTIGSSVAPCVGKRGNKIVARSLNGGGGLHGRGKKSKKKTEKFIELINAVGRTDVLLIQHTRVRSKRDATRMTRLFGPVAVGCFAAEEGKQNVATVAVIFPHGAEDVMILEADGRWITVEATVDGTRFAMSNVYLPVQPEERVVYLRHQLAKPSIKRANWICGALLFIVSRSWRLLASMI
eukprot:SAG31_NODE_311_length_17866_cov_7.010750_16_plen_207_part_00